ncbi:MAG: hypothetical protein NT051_05400 [Candidatus Micrarchaeota archaeon]|nr:hypothetical protein [Candidatus Micrarchaeota archaeon]
MVLSRRLALAVLVCLSLVLFGCSGNKYVPCCAKSGIYNQATKLLEEYPECTLSGKYTNTFHNCEKNQTLFDAGVVRCKLTDCIGVGIRTECEKIGCVWDGPNPGACHTPQCADINNNIDCEMALCYWDNSSLINHGVCIGSDAWSILPICGDAAPQSCVNEKCTAMMCGYTSFKPGPPIASQDWDPNASVDNASHAPASDLGMSVNLYQTTCDFATMNSRLYSKVKNSKGALWVNAFRFGVGKSFSDYDLSRNFFPASDRFCNVNEGGTVDRYMNYFGNSQICRPPVYSSYICTKNSLGFINQSMCWLYCNNDHMDCGNTSGVRYSCQSTGVTYDTFDGCKAECDPVPANTCTNSNVQFPFLDASGRFHEKLVADYWLDTAGIRAPDDSGQVCIYRSITPSDYMSYNGWYCNNEHGCSHWACNDWYGGYTNEGWGGPWMANVRDPVTGAPPNMGDALSDDLNLNAYYTNHRTVAVDLDFKYYDVGLFYQFVHEAGANPDNTLPYECISSADCMSGFCDQSNYHRSLINMVDGSTHESGCVTLKDGKTMPYLDCSSGFTPDQINGFAAKSEPTSGYFDSGGTYALLTHGEIFSTDGDENNLAYFVPVGPSYGFFDQCGIDHGETQSLCTYSDDCNYGYDGIFLYPSVSGSCPAHSCLKNTAGPSQYKVFAIDFHTNSPPGNWGNCDVASPSKRPYMNMTELGWCEACTYSTLAVQKVGWGADEPYGYAKQGQGISAPLACYEFRGTYDYNATPLSSGTIDYSTGANGLYNSYPGATIEAGVNRSIQSASASQVQKNKDGYYIDGNIGRGKYSANGVFEAASSYYTCNDEWQSGTGWWSNSQLPNPSAPYLREKLQSYLKSNVMPILDVIPSQSSLAPVLGSQYNHGSSRECCRYFGVWSNSYSDCWGSCDTEGDCPSTRHYCVEGRYPVYANSYSPTEICTAYSADGAIIYVVGNTSMLASTSETYGSILQDDKAITRAVVDELGLASSDNPGLLLDGKSAIITRALLLKYTCAHPPLVAVEIDKDATLEELIGTDLMVRDSALRGSLHRFFYDKQQQYAYHVYNGKPETYPDNIDLFMQSWEPKHPRSLRQFLQALAHLEIPLPSRQRMQGRFQPGQFANLQLFPGLPVQPHRRHGRCRDDWNNL